jgi:hypothetical protein
MYNICVLSFFLLNKFSHREKRVLLDFKNSFINKLEFFFFFSIREAEFWRNNKKKLSYSLPIINNYFGNS